VGGNSYFENNKKLMSASYCLIVIIVTSLNRALFSSALSDIFIVSLY
jgi:hypothetical protein